MPDAEQVTDLVRHDGSDEVVVLGIASSGLVPVAARRVSRNATPATQGTETITVPAESRAP